MGCVACTEPESLYKSDLYLYLIRFTPPHGLAATQVWTRLRKNEGHLGGRVLSLLYRSFHWNYFPATSFLSHFMHSLETIQVRTRSVNNEGHFIWRTKYHLDYYYSRGFRDNERQFTWRIK